MITIDKILLIFIVIPVVLHLIFWLWLDRFINQLNEAVTIQYNKEFKLFVILQIANTYTDPFKKLCFISDQLTKGYLSNCTAEDLRELSSYVCEIKCEDVNHHNFKIELLNHISGRFSAKIKSNNQ